MENIKGILRFLEKLSKLLYIKFLYGDIILITSDIDAFFRNIEKQLANFMGIKFEITLDNEKSSFGINAKFATQTGAVNQSIVKSIVNPLMKYLESSMRKKLQPGGIVIS